MSAVTDDYSLIDSINTHLTHKWPKGLHLEFCEKSSLASFNMIHATSPKMINIQLINLVSLIEHLTQNKWKPYFQENGTDDGHHINTWFLQRGPPNAWGKGCHLATQWSFKHHRLEGAGWKPNLQVIWGQVTRHPVGTAWSIWPGANVEQGPVDWTIPRWYKKSISPGNKSMFGRTTCSLYAVWTHINVYIIFNIFYDVHTHIYIYMIYYTHLFQSVTYVYNLYYPWSSNMYTV